tara:strand:- start:136 stop:624 length:489 start_codon:yes stop_codon:yes gene_type:complete
MNTNYIELYNNFIKLTTNKKLYQNLTKQDIFSDRLILFLVHFAFFLVAYKNKKNSLILQDIYDFIFRQLELSIREIGYGDQSINKKMKDYINTFHSLISEFHFWDDLNKIDKEKKISFFLVNFTQNDHLVDYFDNFYQNLKNKTLNSYLNSVIETNHGSTKT